MSRITFLILVFAIVSSGCVENKGETGLNDRLLSIAMTEPEVSSFISENPDHNLEVTVLEPENVAPLSEKYPAIYGSLPEKTLYRLELKKNRGMLVIIDLENKKVLKYFRTAGVSLQ